MGAYDEKFDTPKIVPVVKKGDALFLELFHGRTLAFKDMALSIRIASEAAARIFASLVPMYVNTIFYSFFLFVIIM